jgi:hypothetical protein
MTTNRKTAMSYLKTITTTMALLVIIATPCLTAERPNILYIMSDDHAADGISAYGSRLAKIAPTPNIDRLAK